MLASGFFSIISVIFLHCWGNHSELKPTLSSIQDNIFNQKCAISGCHVGSLPEAHLNLSEGKSYQNLVKVNSFQIRDMMRVQPGRPDSSYLLNKLEGGRLVGDVMPPGAKGLSREEIQVIREWIQLGAERKD